MPNEFKVKNGLVVDQGGANITGSSNISGSLGILASGSNVFTVDGMSGRLFSVDDSLSGSLFSVNTVAGLPIMEAFSDNTVRIGQYGQKALFVSQSNVGFGKEASLGAKVDVSGSMFITGSVKITGSLSTIGTTSLTGSLTQIGDYIHTGSVYHSGSKFLVGLFNQTGSLNITGSTTQIGDNTLIGNTVLSGSINISGSQTFVGVNTITGSVNITGSTIQAGSNTLIGNTTLSGSVTISGSNTPGNLTASIQVYGDIRQEGYHRFDPVTTNINTSISASYVYVSGSTNDLYFSQNSSGFSNVTRLRWLEGNLYTGLLHGGLIVSESLTTYRVTSGSGIVVSMNASLETDPYPTIQFIQWPNLTASIAPLSASYDQSFIAIQATGSTGVIYTQSIPYDDGQYNSLIPIGNVIHQDHATINATATYPSVAYAYKQRTNDFIRAFGALKLSGLNTIVSGSSTGSLSITSGTAFSDGRNYRVDPNNPSYVIETGQPISKIYRYYQSGSEWGYLTNGGNGFQTIDPTQYSNNGVLTPVPGTGANRRWTIQRVFYFPGGATKGIYVYYGNATYASQAEAIANIPYENFIEAPNTAASAVLSAYLIVRNNANFTVSDSYIIQQAGLFRTVGGSGGGGSATTRLEDLSDVNISSVTNLQPLAYNDSTLKWENVSIISSSITGNAKTSTSSSYATTASYSITASYATTASYALSTPPTFIDNFITVGLPGSNTQYNSIKAAVDSITDASVNNTYTVKVYPGVYVEDTITLKSYIAVKGESSTSTVVSASNASASVFVMADQTMVIDMQIQGSTAPSASAIYYSSATVPQTNAIAYAENIRFGTNYTNATCAGSGSGNCILQCSNVKYGGYTDASLKSFDIGFRVTGSGGSIGRMQLRNVTSTNGGVAGTDNNQIFALADAPGCTFIVNGCLLTRATGIARGTGFKVYNGGQLRLTAVNFQRWINGIWAPQTGSAPSIDAIALNFENCTTDVLIEHTGSTGKVSGTDNFLKTQIALDAPLYEVGQDPRRITVGKKGADFTSISASVAYITDSSETNRYVIEVGPGQFTEKTIDLTGKPYVSIVGSNIQTTQIFPSSSNQHIIKMGINNELSFLSLANAGTGYSAIYVDDVGDFAQVHKISIYDSDRGITVLANSQDTQFYGEYVDINGTFNYGTYVSSSNGASVFANIENYYLFPSASATIGNYAIGPSSSLSLQSATLTGDGTLNSVAIQLEDGADLESSAVDMPGWDIGVYVPNVGAAPDFKMVGVMIHDSVTYDFHIVHPTAKGRFQGISNHGKINNTSPNFYWNFLDDEDGENDVTRKLSVTFADGTHTDATTLIFKGSPMGVMQGGEITISGSLTINTAAGFGYLETVADPDVYKRIDWVNSTLVLSPNTNNYIYLDETESLLASSSAPDNTQNIILGRVVTNDTGIELIDQSPYDGAHTSNKLSKFNRDALGPVFAQGSIVSEDVTPLKLDVTAGSYFFSENNFTPAGTSSLSFTQYYRSGSGWNKTLTNTVVSNVFDSGSNVLSPLSASAYTKHTLYLVGEGVDEEYFLVIGQNQYSSLVEAEGAGLPTPPNYFTDGVVSLASIYVRSGSANIIQIQDIRPIIGFRAAGVNASATHGNLLGLTADDHLQYLRVDGFREMTGDLGLGGNDLYNINSIFASAITSSGASITDIKAVSITGSLFGNATSADFSTTASFALTASSADSFTVRNSLTASNALINGTITAQTLIVQTITSSVDFVTGSTRFGTLLSNTHQFTGSVIITGSLSVNGNNVILANQTSSMSVLSASFAQTASYILNAVSSSYAFTASSAISSSFAQTASYVLNAVTASYVLNAISSSYAFTASSAVSAYTASSAVSSSMSISASYAYTASSAISAYTASSAISSSIAISSSFAQSAFTASSAISSSVAISASFAQSAYTASSAISSSFSLTASYALNAGVSSTITVADEGTAQGVATFLNFTGAGVTATVSSNTASINIPGGVTSAFPYTGSAQITGSLGVTGSISVIDGAFIGSLFGTASWAQNFLTSSVSSASYANYAFTASSAVSASLAISSSFATTAISSSFPIKVTGSTLISVLPDTALVGIIPNASIFFGTIAGQSAPYANNSNFFGTSAGRLAASASTSNFFGTNAGLNATNANNSNFFGSSAGNAATYASLSNFLGVSAGQNAASASFSTLIGNRAGFNAGAANLGIKSNNIIIGTNITLADGTQDSINLGGVLFGTGTYSTTTGNPLSGSTGGKIGINQPNPIVNLDVSGSGRYSNGLNITGSLIAPIITGSLFGTASWAQNFLTSSVSSASYADYAFTASSAVSAYTASSAISASISITSSFATYAFTASSAVSAYTASSAINSTNAITASSADNFVVRQSITASNALINGTITAQTLVVQTVSSSVVYSSGSNIFGNSVTNTQDFTGSVRITGSLDIIGRATITNLTGSLFGTASWAQNFLTSSVSTASFASYAFTASSAVSAYTASSAISSSYALTASFLIGGASSAITIADEGTAQGTATFLNFTGTAVTATVSANTASINITGGSGGGLATKAGSVANSSFTGNPKKATVTFSTAFATTNYAITVTGEDARSWTIESKAVGSFVISANSNTALSGTTYWIATAYGETT